MQSITRDIEHDTCDIIDDEDEDMDLYGVRMVRGVECGVYRLLSDSLDRGSMRESRSRRCSFYDDTLSSCEILTLDMPRSVS